MKQNISRIQNPYVTRKKLEKSESDYLIDLKIPRDRSDGILPDSRTPIKATTPMQKISVMASPGTDAFLKETMPRQYNVDPMDSPTLEFVEPGTDPREYDHKEEQIDYNRQYASGLSKLVYEQNEIDS